MEQSPASSPNSTPKLHPWVKALGDVGWFIAPFVQMGVLSRLAGAAGAVATFGEDDLERELAMIYRPISLAAMVTIRYPAADVLKDYAVTIGEAVEAHILGLDHIAVGGLVPVIEGAGRRLAALHAVDPKGSVKTVLRGLIDACKARAHANRMGAVDEVLSMLESFALFLEDYLYAKSDAYQLSDHTNRHGIAHGVYSDAEYGRPLNFYKTIAAVDCLTFISTFIGGGSWLAPDPTPRSVLLAGLWIAQREAREMRRGLSMPDHMIVELEEIRNASPWLAKLPLDAPVPV